jgi:hypothetical protein
MVGLDGTLMNIYHSDLVKVEGNADYDIVSMYFLIKWEICSKNSTLNQIKPASERICPSHILSEIWVPESKLQFSFMKFVCVSSTQTGFKDCGLSFMDRHVNRTEDLIQQNVGSDSLFILIVCVPCKCSMTSEKSRHIALSSSYGF